MTEGQKKISEVLETLSFNQAQYCRAANKKIAHTQKMLNPKTHDNFLDMQRNAWEKAFGFMVRAKIYDEDRNLLKGTHEEADSIFLTQYQLFLDKEKSMSAPLPFSVI